MEWGTKKADEMGVEAFIEASELGGHLYEKFGFVVVSKSRTETNIENASEEWKDMAARFPPHTWQVYSTVVLFGRFVNTYSIVIGCGVL
jgi:hypothetical protein